MKCASYLFGLFTRSSLAILAIVGGILSVHASDPASETTAEASDHWAFQPIKKPAVPAVRDTSWVQNPIDAFVLAKLEAQGLTPSPRADKRTLLRRASFDVIGLPPSHEETDEFLNHDSSEAYARVIDRLLASPHYGERWARHWLDVARYADTKGYVFEEERRFPYSYTYRDYVVRSLNEDLPYDQFLVEQIAADLLPLGEDKRPLAALGFLTLGRRFLNNQHDIIDDRIDVVTRGTMGLTVSCARCHDHKYDPVPTADYYSLYGVFASASEPAEKPLLGVEPEGTLYQEYLAERQKRQNELDEFRSTKESEALSEVRKRTGDYLLVAHEVSRLNDESKIETIARERKLHPQTAKRWFDLVKKLEDKPHPILGPWLKLAAAPEDEFAKRARELVIELTDANANENKELNPLVALALAGEPPKEMKELAERYGKLFSDVEQRWQQTLAAVRQSNANDSSSGNRGFGNPDLESVRQFLYGPESPANVPGSEIMRLFDVPTAQKVRALRRKVEELDATHPGAPPRAMALQDNSNPHNPRVFLRGNPNNHGPEVPRQFLQLLSGSERRPFEKGSGRLELAQAIASRENPLTARVIVNRIWMHYFGAGFVRTPSDFGVRCDPPSHPELLDYLAAQFMDEGWSLKKLHRLILLSNTYQQTSDLNPTAAAVDPSNQLLWRMNRRRLDFESMRDSLLAVSGQLNFEAGGRPVDITTKPFTTRRTIYAFVERQNLPSVFRVFDFANPDTTCPQRFSTTVPQQGLYMINSPFVVEQARKFLLRPEASATEPAERIRALYRLAFQRDPDPEELELGVRFIEKQPPAASESGADALNSWEKYAQVLLMSNELVFVD